MSQKQQGIFQRAGIALFGERTQRLRETTTGAHALSYLLVTVQSAAVVLALGHQQLQLLLSGDPTIVLIASLALFLLVSSVVAADLCLLATLQRLPVLSRNRSTWSLIEHLAYLAFVLLVEGSTLALVLATLDTDPHALISSAPIIPATGWLFGAMIGARAALTGWTAAQLWIVRGKLPPQWSTLLLEARELLGGKAQSAMSSLNLDGASLSALFHSYAQMSRPPVRVGRWWNRGLLAREAAALAEEDRQREAVVRALSAFDTQGTPLSNGAHPRPPTGGGTPLESKPAADDAPASKPTRPQVLRLTPGTPPKRRQVAARTGVRTPPMRTDVAEAAARAAWVRGMSVTDLQKAAGIPRTTASRWRAIIMAEEAGQQQVAQ